MTASALTGADIQPAESVAEHLIDLLQDVLTQEPLSHEVACARKRTWPSPHLAVAAGVAVLLMGILRQAQHLSTIWRWLCLQPIGSFTPVLIPYQALRKRLLAAGTAPLHQLLEDVSRALQQWAQTHPALTVASFAHSIVALDESTLDRLRRLTEELREVPAGDPHLLPGKIAGLFDLRTQRWVRVQFRADVLVGCNVGMLLLLEGLAAITLWFLSAPAVCPCLPSPTSRGGLAMPSATLIPELLLFSLNF